MTKARTTALADSACAVFNSTVDGLVMQKLKGLPDLGGIGVVSANPEARNNVPAKPGQDIIR